MLRIKEIEIRREPMPVRKSDEFIGVNQEKEIAHSAREINRIIFRIIILVLVFIILSIKSTNFICFVIN